MATPRRIRILALLVAGLVLLAACTSSSAEADSAPPERTGDSSEAPTPTTSGDNTTVTADPAVPLDPPLVSELDSPPSALDDMFNASFPPPLIPPEEVLSGGPPPDGIPAIDDPKFAPIDEIDFIADNEPVLVLDIDGDVRAYPIQIMIWHEIANDVVGGVPVTVSFCPLCNSAVAFKRTQPDGTILDFGTSGRLYFSSLVMYDRQTETLWTHFDGTAVIGVLTGTVLEKIPLSTVSYRDFREAHPEGLVLTKDTGFTRNYGRNPYPGYDDVNTAPFLFRGEADGRLPAQTKVIAVRGETETVAVTQEYLAEERVIPFEVDGTGVVALLEPGTSSGLDSVNIAEGREVGATGVFIPEVDGQTLTLSADGDSGFVDAETSTRWNILGEAVEGPLAGSELPKVEHLDTFWFAIAAFNPDTVVITADGVLAPEAD
ncbi:MAG TPA: DUF3179 domain-containing protein [Acidimicrobiales bacterium]|nr:DUF3179 domain-containing protein [Acidimicrobiales bacterium]